MAMTSAEKMRAYRQRKKEAGLKQRNVWVKAGEGGQEPRAVAEPAENAQGPAEEGPDINAIRDQVKAELQQSWEPTLKAERIAEQRREGRKLARKADQSRTQGRIIGLCQAADFFVGKDRVDIAQALLAHFVVDREKAEGALQADKRTKSLTLESLDRVGAWDKPPEVIR